MPRHAVVGRVDQEQELVQFGRREALRINQRRGGCAGGRDRVVQTFEVALGIERRHAARSRRRDRLAVDVVLHVAGREHARHARLRSVSES